MLTSSKKSPKIGVPKNSVIYNDAPFTLPARSLSTEDFMFFDDMIRFFAE